jgi:hypothetical protein
MLREIWRLSLKRYLSISPETPGIVENVFVGADCSPEEIQIYTDLFKEFRDVFAWSYEAIPDIDPQSVDHGIPLLFFKLALRPKRNIR